MVDYFRIARTAGMAFLGAALLAGCSSPSVDQIDLMPAPDVYGDGLLNPLPDAEPYNSIAANGILFATDRRPSSEGDKESYYLSDPGYAVRVGRAEIQFGKKDFTWEMAREVSLLKSRTERFPVKISNVDEWGILRNTLPFWLDISAVPEELRPPDASREFADAVNRQLAASRKKHVYIYVHGYKVTFENPVLVSAELWHFLGYNGAFIAYSWPSTPSQFAYIRDSDTSVGFARNLRLLLEFIGKETDAEEVHIIGYSNGTRLVLRALEQLALMQAGNPGDQPREDAPIGNIILVGSDIDRAAFGAFLSDGLLDVVKHMSIYISSSDKALGASRFLTRRERLGEEWGVGGHAMEEAGRRALMKLQDKLSFISVSEAEGSTKGKGHGYFRSSPWVSSDVLMTLYYDLTPQQRGLVMQEDMPIYSFPPDYISRLWNAIKKEDPAFAQRYEHTKQKSGTAAPLHLEHEQ